MDRTKFYNQEVVDGVAELDFLNNVLSDFEIKHTPKYYRTDEHDVSRPDLISWTNYGTVAYWWIICLVNNIQNPLSDIEVGMILKIPHLTDIYSFYKRYTNR